VARTDSAARAKEDTITDTVHDGLGESDYETVEIESLTQIEFAVGDCVVYPHHGAGTVIKKELKQILGEEREYLTIRILHNEMTVMVPTANAHLAGLRRVVSEETLARVLEILTEPGSAMPGTWSRRVKHNRDKIKTGDVCELAEVVRNLAIREHQKGLSTGEKQMYMRARQVLASELMYALDMDEVQVEAHLADVILTGVANAATDVAVPDDE
jgi:CarD family transcriptional regulator